MKKKMKGVLFAALLAVAGLFGVSSTLIDKQVNETPMMEKADAASQTYLYLKYDDCVWKSWGAAASGIKIHVWGGSKGTSWPGATGTSVTIAGSSYIRYTISSYTGATSCAFNAWNGGSNQNQTVDLTIPTDGKNVFVITSTSSDSKQTGSWSFHADKTITSKTVYFDANSWGITSSNSVQIRFFDDLGDYEEETVSTMKTGTYRFYSKSTTKNWNKVLMHLNNAWTKKTDDLTIPTDGKNCYLTGSSEWVTTTGSVYTITQKKKVGDAAATVFRTSYIFGGLSYQTESLPTTTETGHTKPTQWSTNDDGTGTKYTPGDYTSSISSDIVLYAYYSKEKYTITFNPNGGTGSVTTRDKTYNDDFTIPSLSDLGIDAGVGRVATGWNTQSDGKGTPYTLGGTYTDNAATTLYLMQDYKSYEYSVDGGSSWVQMPKMEETPSLCIAGYESDASNYLPSGAMITFRSYYGTGEHSAQTINIWSGNTYEYGGNHYIEFGTHDKVVLTVQNDGNFKVDIYGGSERGIDILRNDVDTKYVSEKIGNDYYATVEVLPGDKIRAFHSWRTVYDVTMTGYSSYGIDVNGNVTVPAVYYLKLVYVDGNYPNVNVVNMVVADTAKLIAQTFIEDITPICEGIEGGAASSTLNTQWSTETGYYNKLSDDTKNLLKNGATSDTDILAMRAKYDRVVGKYKSATITDYMGRNPAQLGAIRNFSPFSMINGEDGGDNATTIIIIIAASVSLLSVTALSVLLVKKRKNKEQ